MNVDDAVQAFFTKSSIDLSQLKRPRDFEKIFVAQSKKLEELRQLEKQAAIEKDTIIQEARNASQLITQQLQNVESNSLHQFEQVNNVLAQANNHIEPLRSQSLKFITLKETHAILVACNSIDDLIKSVKQLLNNDALFTSSSSNNNSNSSADFALTMFFLFLILYSLYCTI